MDDLFDLVSFAVHSFLWAHLCCSIYQNFIIYIDIVTHCTVHHILLPIEDIWLVCAVSIHIQILSWMSSCISSQ